MQSSRWYLKRLASMSPGEIWWRCGGKVQSVTDRVFRPWRARLRPLGQIVHEGREPAATSPTALGTHLSDLGFAESENERWRAELVDQAQRIADHHLDLFDLMDHPLGAEVDWNYEYKAKRHAPMAASSTVNYRDHRVTGDCKFVWEPNRHHQWVVLGRAYHITRDERYAEALAGQFESWLLQCPYGLGMNWRSPLELGIRLISWSWAFELIADSAVMTDARRARILQVVYQHLCEITRKYSRYSSANNHLIGEAAGVFMASSHFSNLRKASRWRSQSRKILLREILRQTYADGGPREQATGYHLFILEFFLLAGLVARHTGDDFPADYWDRVEKMLEFTASMSDGSGSLPMIGDADDGYVINLGGQDDTVSSWLCVGAILFNRPDFKIRAGAFREPALWLLGSDGRQRYEAIDTGDGEAALRSRAFPNSGYYLLQRGQRDSPARISLTFDCGELGFLSIAAHGHADALSVLLSVGGFEVLVDPGTYDYFTYESWRRYFRSTCAHNTLAIDGEDQSEMVGSFLWGRRARCRLVAWNPTDRGGTVEAQHDGYTRLLDPVVHRRSVTLQDNADDIVVQDEVLGRDRHHVTLYWHFAEQCRVEPKGDNRFDVDFGGGTVVFSMDPSLKVSIMRGSTDPIGGWVSRGYHRKTASVTLVGQCVSDGNLSLATRMTIRTSSRRRSAREVLAHRADAG